VLGLGGHNTAPARREPFPPVRRRTDLVAGAHLGPHFALAGAIGLALLLGFLAGFADFFPAPALEAVVSARAQRGILGVIDLVTISDFLM
jgi:hypothetical protein